MKNSYTMLFRVAIGALALTVVRCTEAGATKTPIPAQVNYARPFELPTRPAFLPLPPGAVEPQGWLRDWCLAAKDGYTGHMDEVDDEFKRAWAADHKMTGEGLMWYKGAWPYEGGGYWFDGLVRLGYALHDDALIQQAKKRLDVVADNMNTNSLLFLWWLNKNNPEDRKAVIAALDGWPLWACGLLGRAMTGCYAESGDKRILDALEKAYGGDPDCLRWIPGNLSNLWPAYDTYTWTGNKGVGKALDAMFKEEGAGLLPNVNRYRKAPDLTPGATVTNAHVVEFVESTTPWAVGYLWTGNTNYLQAAVGWHDLIERIAMQPYGVPVSDEWYVPTGAFRGSETCDVANYIWSQTALLAVTGEGRMADRAERAFFNAGAATVSRDFKSHVYFQSPNRFASGSPNFPHGPMASGGVYQQKHGPLCCTAALNRVVPYYVTHMWMATYDNGLAATCYGPCKVTALAADRVPVEITCKTDYPFNEVIEVSVKPSKKAAFPIYFHIPGWCAKPELSVNGSAVKIKADAKGFACVSRTWKPGDAVRLRFPMTAVVLTGRDNTPDTPYTGEHKPTVLTLPGSDSVTRGLPYASVSYGPLLFSLAIPDTTDANTPDPDARWRFALDIQNPELTVERGPMPANWNWPLESPLKLRANAVGIDWNPATGMPRLPSLPISKRKPSEKITLIPYGCTKFRISMFPVTAETEVKTKDIRKILFLGNSITLHGPAESIGWTNNCGMAASSEEKDYVHLVTGAIAQHTGAKQEIRVRNIADFERNYATYDVDKELQELFAFDPDLVVLAIGENAPGLGSEEAKAQFKAGVTRILKGALAKRHPLVVVRSCFWADAAKDQMLREACQEANGIFVNAGPLGGDASNAARAERPYKHEGVAGHPGDKGMKAIADAIVNAILTPRTAPAFFVQNRLVDTFATEAPVCRGWGKWETPCVYANSGTEKATFLDGIISIPPRNVAVHPGEALDVAVGWQSPVAGKVNVQAKVTHAHPTGGDGVSWAIIHAGQSGRRVLVQGVIDRAGSQSIPEAGKLLAATVQKGDGLILQIGPRDNYHCDSTVVELVITEADAPGRVWDLVKEVVPDMQAGNPHADSLGNAAVWHFFAPERALDDSFTASRPAAGRRAKSWTLATDDTRLTVGATATGQLCVYELSNPASGWNWTEEPSVFALLGQAEIGNVVQDLSWKFKEGTMDKADGQKLTLRFVCDNPALELSSEWWARPGSGPVHHVMRIANQSDKPVTLFEQPTFHLDLAGPAGEGSPKMWTFHSDGGTPDKAGVYRHTVEPPFTRQIRTHPDGEFIPYAVFDAGGKQGVYVGIEWSYCRIAAATAEGYKAGSLRVRGGEFAGFRISVRPGETFETPPGFIGAYRGDVDDAGNSLRKYLFKHNMPEVVRKDATYPKIQWNAFGATGDKPGGWNSVEAKYYPLVDDIAPLGFEEVMLDVGWWKGGTSAPEPEGDPVDWASGMAKAAEHAHKAGLRFGLYWNKGEEMASPEGRNQRMTHIKRLYNEYKADMWRSDNTAGAVVGASYASVKGIYAMLDQLRRDIPNFQWENCCSGGRVKDFGAMSRCVKIFMTDTYAEHHVRQAFYDSSYALPPAQLEGCLGSTDGAYRPKGTAGMKFAFRTVSMGAPEWFIDAPNGGNGSAPWTQEEKDAVKTSVATYKNKIRPLVRNADLYHILPRPDGKNWDGIQYYDPLTKKGVAYLFKPAAGTDSTVIKLRGVEPKTTYRVTFEDGTNPSVEKTGAELAKGIEVTLKGSPVSELLFLDAR